MVMGNATLFDGSVVETGQATADLRLEKGTEILLARDSRGTLHRDRLVLQGGQSEFSANSSFQLEASGLHVTPIEPDSRGVVSVKEGNTVEVAALKGILRVTTEKGVLLASVRPGLALSFAIAAQAPIGEFIVGVVSFENGHYYLTTVDDAKYELIGRDFKKFTNTKVVVEGVQEKGGSNSSAGIPPIIQVTSIQFNSASAGAGAGAGAGGLSAGAVWTIVGVAAGAAILVGVFEATKASASR
jgi:hypothetical protein